jgi:hypothetical protein
VVVGEYYYNNKTKSIERRKKKRKRGEIVLKKESSKINNGWKAGLEPKENEIQIASVLEDKRDHITHLRKIFNRCRRYGISPNPKKYVFVVNEGKLFGFIVSKYGMMIEPRRTQEISIIYLPHNKKSM